MPDVDRIGFFRIPRENIQLDGVDSRVAEAFIEACEAIMTAFWTPILAMQTIRGTDLGGSARAMTQPAEVGTCIELLFNTNPAVQAELAAMSDDQARAEGIALGIHEMAHLLRGLAFMNQSDRRLVVAFASLRSVVTPVVDVTFHNPDEPPAPLFWNRQLRKFKRAVDAAVNAMTPRRYTNLRARAGSNFEEFWALAFESYFRKGFSNDLATTIVEVHKDWFSGDSQPNVLDTIRVVGADGELLERREDAREVMARLVVVRRDSLELDASGNPFFREDRVRQAFEMPVEDIPRVAWAHVEAALSQIQPPSRSREVIDRALGSLTHRARGSDRIREPVTLRAHDVKRRNPYYLAAFMQGVNEVILAGGSVSDELIEVRGSRSDSEVEGTAAGWVWGPRPTLVINTSRESLDELGPSRDYARARGLSDAYLAMADHRVFLAEVNGSVDYFDEIHAGAIGVSADTFRAAMRQDADADDPGIALVRACVERDYGSAFDGDISTLFTRDDSASWPTSGFHTLTGWLNFCNSVDPDDGPLVVATRNAWDGACVANTWDFTRTDDGERVVTTDRPVTTLARQIQAADNVRDRQEVMSRSEAIAAIRVVGDADIGRPARRQARDIVTRRGIDPEPGPEPGRSREPQPGPRPPELPETQARDPEAEERIAEGPPRRASATRGLRRRHREEPGPRDSRSAPDARPAPGDKPPRPGPGPLERG